MPKLSPQVKAGMDESKAKQTCVKCRRELKAKDNFYSYRDGTKCEMCKDCLTMHVNNFMPDTYKWLCEKFDIPYVPDEWNYIREKQLAKSKDGTLSGSAVFGKYLAKMHLNQWNKYHYADTAQLEEDLKFKRELAEQNAQKMAEQAKELLRMYEDGEITKLEYETYSAGSTHRADIAPPEVPAAVKIEEAPPTPDPAAQDARGINNYFKEEMFEPELQDDISEQLTQEDKTYLQMKWGRFYTASEWISLEKKYVEMTKSFTIKDSDTEGSLILICKTYLKMNQALDEGNTEEYQRLARAYDALRKSANFMAVQNKEKKDESIKAIGQLVFIAEKYKGKIPRPDLSYDLDMIDTVIKDLKTTNTSIIKEDPTISHQIEQYLKRKQLMDNHSELAKDMEEQGSDEPAVITDEDHFEFLNKLLEDAENESEEFVGNI